MNKIKKPWGWEKLIEQNERYIVKQLFMKAGCQCSLQYHEDKIETITVLEGELTIKLGHNGKCRKDRILKPFESLTILTNQVHRMYSEKDCLYLECSTPELQDVTRLEDDYGRV